MRSNYIPWILNTSENLDDSILKFNNFSDHYSVNEIRKNLHKLNEVSFLVYCLRKYLERINIIYYS